MASIHDCYPDWESFESATLLKKKKKNSKKNANNFMNYEGFYPLEGFTNQAQEVNQKEVKASSNALNITYGAPSEYFPAEYNTTTYQQNTVPKNNKKKVVEEKETIVKVESTNNDSELKREIEEIRAMLSTIMDKLDTKKREDVSSETTMHDMILFVIFGLFVIFALEGTAKIIANLAKKGKF